MSVVIAWLAALMPLAILLGVLWLVERRRGIRMDAIERQIAMTDAIHRELGAIVAPTVTRTPLGGWRVLVPVPFEQPAVISRVLEIARDTVAPVAMLRGRAWEIVLVPQTPPAAREGRAGSRHAFADAPRVIPAGYGRSGGPGARTQLN
jgi:hypothetical protein